MTWLAVAPGAACACGATGLWLAGLADIGGLVLPAALSLVLAWGGRPLL